MLSPAKHSVEGSISPDARYELRDLRVFTAALLSGAGLDENMAEVVADTLLEADLMGFRTHGLQLLAGYLNRLSKGEMAKNGEPSIVQQSAASALWDGHFLPGQWLTRLAVDAACQKAVSAGVGSVVVSRSQHVGCLAAYLTRATDQGLMMLMSASDPYETVVAPYGGVKPVFSPNPIAMGAPGDPPILFDTSTSILAKGQVKRAQRDGEKLPFEWVLDSRGKPSADPDDLFSDPPGSILPIGGLDHGFKGYAFALLTELLTNALGGNGRASKPEHHSNSLFVLVLNPSAFSGAVAFEAEANALAEACANSKPRPGVEKVRVPGQRAQAKKAEQSANGVALDDAILKALKPWAEELSVRLPRAKSQCTDGGQNA